MKLIGTVNRENSNTYKCALMGILITTITMVIMYNINPFNLGKYLSDVNNFTEVLLLTPTCILIFTIHELIHIFFFIVFGKNKAIIKIARDKKLGAVIVRQMNDGVYYSKIQTITTLLAPMIILNTIMMYLSFTSNYQFILFFNILLNTLGSSVDIYISMKILFRYKESKFFNYSTEEINMNIYT